MSKSRLDQAKDILVAFDIEKPSARNFDRLKVLLENMGWEYITRAFCAKALSTYFECLTCKKSFSSKANLRKHLRSTKTCRFGKKRMERIKKRIMESASTYASIQDVLTSLRNHEIPTKVEDGIHDHVLKLYSITSSLVTLSFNFD